MAAASSLPSEDHFLCSICMDVFTEPVTIPCGHNYCKACITKHWDCNLLIQCPMCKKDYNSRPEVNVNTFISEMAAQLRVSLQQMASSRSSEEQFAKAGDVSCDLCKGTKLKAVKSCLACFTSYCETHLQPHLTTRGLQRHTLIHPVSKLEDRVCKKHEKPLEMFCETDQVCVCQFCIETNHTKHRFVPLGDGYNSKKAQLRKTKGDVQQMIQERHQKIKELTDCLKLSKEDAEREITANKQVVTALIQSVQSGLDQLSSTIEEAQKTREKQAEGFIRELKEEIFDLLKMSSDAEQLWDVDDHLQFLQTFSSLSPIPPTKNCFMIGLSTSHEQTARAAVSQLEERLTGEVTKLCFKSELNRLKRFAVDLTLDPETALCLTMRNKCGHV